MTEKKKKPYKTPSLRTEKIFERRALACVKVQPPLPVTPPPCRGQYKQS
jgi:hypothetical protein